MNYHLSFNLPDQFVNDYAEKDVNWGFPIGGGNSLGELVYYTSYSRLKDDGSKERWHETCRRVIEGMFSITKDHCERNRTPWNEQKAQASAKQAYERMFNFKWLPPGRGLWAMGSNMVHESNNSAALQNCSFVSTSYISSRSVKEATLPFVRMMEMSMNGIGVGFDTKGAGKLKLHKPDKDKQNVYVVPDSREGWAESLGVLLESFFFENRPQVIFDYSEVRPAGAPLVTFGGTASGPGPLKSMHEKISELLSGRDGAALEVKDIVDIMNLAGKAVVAGGTRRCMPEGTLVKTPVGFTKIEEIKQGDLISTALGEFKVTNSFNQGEQETVIINHRFGSLECTPNHQVAVFDGVGSWRFKRADELSSHDALVFDPTGYEGARTALPEYVFNRLSHNTTGIVPTIPSELTEDVAWLVGLIHGDGYVGEKALRIAVHEDQLAVADKAKTILLSWGLNVSIKKKKGERCHEVVATNAEVCRYLRDCVKMPNETLKIPEWIKGSTRNNRAAYLAGLFDADGCSKSRPTVLLSTVYEDFAEEVLCLYVSLGILPHYGYQRPAKDNWQELYSVSLKDKINLSLFSELVGEHSARYEAQHESKSQFGFAYPTALVANDFKGKWITRCNDHQTLERVMANLEIEHMGYPVPVLSVTKGRMVSTYDIEVDEIHQFTANGFVVHNSAQIAFGELDDKEFITLKDYEKFPERNSAEGWSYLSNNSITVKVGDDLSHVIESIQLNGEPGLFYLDLARQYSRLVDAPDNKDHRVMGANPCSEQSLEHNELCCLVEVFPHHHDSLEDFKATLKYAYLYGKAVTLMPTPWPESNEVMQRNRRIGCSLSGLSEFAEKYGWTELRTWMNQGYGAIQDRDRRYSEWLGVRESIKKTSIKPSGSVSLVAGATPGVHWPTGSVYTRRMRLAVTNPLVDILSAAGYHVEPDVMDSEHTRVVELPTLGRDVRTEKDVTIWEKTALAVLAQRYWADNQVSYTCTFKEDEKDQIESLIRAFEGQLKGLSFLPILEGGSYPQMPYEEIDLETYEKNIDNISEINRAMLYAAGADAESEKYCSNDVCEIKPPSTSG